MSDQSAAPDQAPEQSNAPAPEVAPAPSGPPEWLGPIEERMNELRDQNQAVAEQLSSLTQPVEEEDEFDWYDEDGDLTPEAAQQIIDQRVEEALSAQLSQRDAHEALQIRDLAFDELRERVPGLADDKVAIPLVQEVAADLTAAGYDALIETPQFVDLVERAYKAQLYDEHAASETPHRRGVVLESGAGAAPQQRNDEEDWGERIVKAAERLSPRI